METVVLLGKENADDHIQISLNVSDLKKNVGGSGSYPEIKAYVEEHYGFKVSSLYIAQIKEKYGIKERENYNKPKKLDSKQAICTPEKEAAIVEAFKFFGMIA